jgi:hypothetical protein
VSRQFEGHFKSHDAGGVLYINTLAIKVDPTGPDLTEVTPQQAADHLNTWLGGHYRDLLHNSYTLDEVGVRSILPDDGSEAVHAVGLPGLLTGVGAISVPKELAAVITLKTSTATRSGRGRMFMPSPRNVGYLGDVTNWATGTDYWNFLAAFGDAILAGHTFTIGPLEFHMSGRVHSRAKNTSYDITAYVRRTPYHFLRSRSTAP